MHFVTHFNGEKQTYRSWVMYICNVFECYIVKNNLLFQLEEKNPNYWQARDLNNCPKWSCIYQSEMREGCGCVDIGKPSAMEVKFSCSRFNLALS